MSRILKKMAFVAIAVSCSFGMEKDDTEILRENIKLSLIKAYEKPPTEEEIEKALNKIMPYAPQLKLEKEINIIEYSDGQFGDTLCQLRALEWYLRLTSNDVGPLRRFASAFDLATRKKYYDLNIVRYPLQDLDYLKKTIKNLKVAKEEISGEQNFATALRSAYLQEMYRFFGYSLDDSKIRFVKGLTPQFSYPALEFFESYYFMINQIEEFKIPVTVLYMEFVNDGGDVLLYKTRIVNPYNGNKNKSDLSIVFEMYSSRCIDDEPFELPLNDSKFFRDAVLAIAAAHSQYPDSKNINPEILSKEAKPYYEFAIKENFGVLSLFEFNRKDKTITPTKEKITLNTFHVYLSDEALLKKRVDELKEGEKLQYMGDK